jgi:hypothetical protein
MRLLELLRLPAIKPHLRLADRLKPLIVPLEV